MFVPLSPQTEKMGERMNSAMNHRRGGGLWKMIRRTAPVITEELNCAQIPLSCSKKSVLLQWR